MRWTRSTIAAAAITLGVVLFFAVNMTSDVWFSSARIDLTENGLYTVSPVSYTHLTLPTNREV